MALFVGHLVVEVKRVRNFLLSTFLNFMMNKKKIPFEYLNLILMLNFVLHRFWGLCFVILMTVFVTQMGSCLVRDSHALEEDYLKTKKYFQYVIFILVPDEIKTI